MDLNFEIFITNLLKSEPEPEAFLKQLRHCAHIMGFPFFTYIIFACYPARRPIVKIEGNFPDRYIDDYLSLNLYLADPMIEQAHHSTLQFQWDRQFYSQASELWLKMANFGIKEGWSQSIKDCSGRLGILIFAGEEIPALKPATRATHETFFSWLAQLAHKTLRETLLPACDDAIKDDLTSREKDMLRWCSEGKTSEEIALLLGLSVRTVNFHISNAIRKLSVANKTAATAKAVYLQLI